MNPVVQPSTRTGAGLLRALGWFFLVICLAICVWAQFITFDGPPTCGGEPMRPTEVCVDFSGDRPSISYDDMYAMQSATIGIRTMNGSVLTGAIGAFALFLACWRTVVANQLTPREAFLHTLLFATAPLLVLAVVVQVLAAKLGYAWASPIGVPGMTQGVLIAIVALGGAAIMPYARREAIRSAQIRTDFRFKLNLPGLTEQERREAEQRARARQPEELAARRAFEAAQAEAAAAKQEAAEREAALKALRKVPLVLTDPASDLWAARRAEISDVPPPHWQVLVQRVAGVLGLAALAGALTTGGWLASGLGVAGLVLVSSRPSSRPPTPNTALLWGASAVLALGVALVQLLPVQPLSWHVLVTSVLVGAGAYYKVQSVSFASERARTSHVWYHLSGVVIVPVAVLLALSATISGPVQAVLAYLAAYAGLALAFPGNGQFPPRWRAFRLGLLGVLLIAGTTIALLGATPTTWIGGGVLVLAAVVSAVRGGGPTSVGRGEGRL